MRSLFNLLNRPVTLISIFCLYGCNSSSNFSGLKGSQTAATASTPAITTNTTLPSATLASSYVQVLIATSGTPPYTFAVASGTLPTGLTLDTSAGVISGTPTAVGAAKFSVSITDNLAQTQTFPFKLTVGASAAPVIGTTSLASGQVNIPFSQSISATGGVGAYTFSISSGSLPAGIIFSTSTGVFSGTPSVAGVYAFSVSVVDSVGGTASQNMNLTISASPFSTLTFSSTTILPLSFGVTTSRTITATGGLSPYTFSVTSGSLPAGMTFNTAPNGTSFPGMMSGTPTTLGSSTFTVQVTDSRGLSASSSFTLKVENLLAVSTSSLPAGIVNTAYSTQVAATGGSGSYTYSASGLPTGVSISSSGALYGLPTVIKSNSVLITVTDSDSLTASQTFTLPVVTTLSLGPSSIGTAGIATSYTATMVPSGGVAPYNYSLTSGTLPSGLTLNASTGVISGLPNAGTNALTGTFPITVQVADSSGQSASKSYTILVEIPPRMASDIANQLRTARQNVPYLDYIIPYGGVGNLTYSATGLPGGLTINSTSGYITGTPTPTPSTYPVTFSITDANGMTGALSKSIKVVGSAKTAGFDTGIVSPLSNNGNGQWRNGWYDLKVADLNGDGKPDIVVREWTSYTVVVGLGNGDGTFTFYYLIPTGNANADKVFIADLNGDGKLDLILTETGNSRIEVIMGDGVWTSAMATRQLITTGANPQQVSIGDLNGDGLPDLVVANYNAAANGASVSVFMNCGAVGTTVSYNGNATTSCSNTSQTIFNYHVAATVASAYTGPQGTALVDLNNDGKLDLVLTTNNSSVPKYGLSVYNGNGNGTFSATPSVITNYATGTWSGYVRSTVDLNGDGKPDLVVQGTDGAYLLFGNGTGGFSSYGYASTSDLQNGNEQHAAVGDINGDGCPDLVITATNSAYRTVSSYSSAEIFYNQKVSGVCTGTMSNKRYLGPNWQAMSVGLGNFLGGTRPDLVVLTSSAGQSNNWDNPRITLYPNLNTSNAFNSYPNLIFSGTFTAPYSASAGPIYFSDSYEDLANYAAPVVADLNGDGYPDFIAKKQGDATVYLGGANATYTLSGYVPTGDIGANNLPKTHLLVDVNGDGIPDYVSANWNSAYYGSIGVSLGKGDGTFGGLNLFFVDQTTCLMGGNSSTNYNGIRAIAPGDFNKDGKMDLIIAHGCGQSSRISIFYGNGDGTFNTASPAIFTPGGNGVDSVLTADVDGDGNLDFAAMINYNSNNTNNYALFIYRGKGSGMTTSSFYSPNTYTVTTPNSLSQGNYLLGFEVGDFNNDGKLDYLYSTNSTNFGIFQGAATGTAITPAATFAANGITSSYNFYHVKAVDWNDDGYLDVIANHQGVGNMLFAGTGASSINSVTTFTLPTACWLPPNPGIQTGQTYMMNFVDLNGDGLPDMIGTIGDSWALSGIGMSFNTSH